MTELRRKPRVAFQGERGAFSEEAALKLLGSEIDLIPRPTFDALFTAIHNSVADFVLAPVENSLAGSVHWSLDLLLESNLQITGEVVHQIAHHLIGLPGASLETIQAVESHPVALAQCERFFREHPRIKRVVAEDTAGSVRAVIARGDRSHAAIAARRAAELYGGKILREHLEDHRENYTRFWLLAPEAARSPAADKVSLVAELAHKPGSLHRALGAFAHRGIDLLKIESRPIPGQPWEYRFYLDLKARPEDPAMKAALEEFGQNADRVHILGWYPSAAGADAAPSTPTSARS